MEQENKRQKRNLQQRSWNTPEDELMISMRFLDRALFRMPLVAADSVAAFGVDGATMYYNPEYVLHAFKREKCLYPGIFTYDITLHFQSSVSV
ncbi:MAG: hypothetical protein ACLUD0_14385 [Eubacterium ramulus]